MITLFNKPFFYSISIVLLSMSHNNTGTLVRAEQLKGSNFFGSETTFRLFYEVHSPHQTAEKEQLTTVVSLFQQQKLPHHILVETPAQLTKEKNELCSVTSNLATELRPYHHVTTEDIEIRHVSNAFCYLFEKSNNPFFINPTECFDSQKKPLENLTFQNVLDEYKLHRTQLFHDLAWCPREIHSAMDEKNKLVEWLYKNFIERIEDGRIKSTDTLLNTSRTFFLKNNAYRATLKMFVLNIFSHIFDAHIIKRLTELRKTPHISLIAGYTHVAEVSSLLRRMQAQQQKCLGCELDLTKPIDSSVSPLSQSQLKNF